MFFVYFVNNIKLEKGDLPPVVDIEETNGCSKKIIQEQLQFGLNLLENKY